MGVNCEDFVNKFNSVKDSIDYSKVKNTITYFFFWGGVGGGSRQIFQVLPALSLN